MSEKGFKATTIEIGDPMLIEASAGTGKTYSIAILVLRILLEEERLNLDEILMVTFTNAAVAELEDRIRKFVRKAHKYAEDKEDPDTEKDIMEVVDAADMAPEAKKERLRDAVQRLDRLSVMTIHSFCQQTIEEFTFETGQSFDFEIISDDTDLLRNQANIYIRREINTLHPEHRKLLEKDMDFGKLHELLRRHLQGMKFLDANTPVERDAEELKSARKKTREELEKFVTGKLDEIIAVNHQSNGIHKAAVEGNTSKVIERYQEQLYSPKPKAYFARYEFMKDEFSALDNPLKQAEKEYLSLVYQEFFRQSKENLSTLKSNSAFISYDDQIRTIHHVRENNLLVENLRKKYKAVFVDEFQDTDRYQYEIFQRVFQKGFNQGEKRPDVFYIGDPKQSIYGWRGADLDTYIAAGKDVARPPEMKYNFRSTEKMLEALNLAMHRDHIGFNLFSEENDDIEYRDVYAGNESLGIMKDRGREVIPVTVWKFRKDDEKSSFRSVANEIQRLLKEDSEARIDGRKILPEDIGVLVRDNREGDNIKRLLEKYNIPAVKRDNKKVLDSDEASMIRYLVEAVLLPAHGSIVRALLSPWYGFTLESIQLIKDEDHLEVFRELRHTLREAGIYNMISRFLDRYDVRSRCMKDLKGQRVLTNINHIAEILHRVERKTRCTPEELLAWMTRAMDEQDEEYEQRIESDENAVQISTIHKAKGLEYNIVFAPGLCIIRKTRREKNKNVNTFKKNGEYYFTFNLESQPEEDRKLHQNQQEEENRRLIYVAMTRAVYKLYISYMPKTYFSKDVTSSMDDLVRAWESMDTKLIEIDDLTEQLVPYPAMPGAKSAQKPGFNPLTLPGREIKNKFGIHSFSALSHVHFSTPFEPVTLEDSGYDHFIFQELGRGANVGTALHSIFEYLAFDQPESWPQSLQDAYRYYPNILKEEKLEQFLMMVEHTLHSRIQFGNEEVNLHKISREQMLPEMEFYFSIDRVNRRVLDELMEEEADLGGESDIAGLMTGLVDLVFEQNLKYYILDWKSNYLGNTVDHYGPDELNAAMKGNNYNLQYMIYTVAMKRYLENSLKDFDYDRHFGGVIYLFLRGLRKGKDTGVFTTRPDFRLIQKLDKAFDAKSGE